MGSSTSSSSNTNIDANKKDAACADGSCDLKEVSKPVAQNPEKKLKPCCACPETKKARDACIVEKGEENCGDLIEEHKKCMRKMGFNI